MILWQMIKDNCHNSKIMTDCWKSYIEMLEGYNHITSKSETYTVEGYNSLLRHFLARLKRKTKCYSKSVEMLYYSVLLIMTKLNKQLSILN
jgi:insertion element IS1 protein InsB